MKREEGTRKEMKRQARIGQRRRRGDMREKGKKIRV